MTIFWNCRCTNYDDDDKIIHGYCINNKWSITPMVANEGGRQIYCHQMILSVDNLSCNDYKNDWDNGKVVIMVITNNQSLPMKGGGTKVLAPDDPIRCQSFIANDHDSGWNTDKNDKRVIPCQICMIFLDPLKNVIFVSYLHNHVPCDVFQPNSTTLAHFWL